MPRTPATTRSVATRTNNILYNGNFEQAFPNPNTAQTATNNRWINGTVAGDNGTLLYGWAQIAGAANGKCGWDNTVSNSGTYSMKISTTTTGSTSNAATFKSSGTPPAVELFAISASTSYTLKAQVKTTNVVTNSAFLDFRQYDSSRATLVTTSSTKLSGTNAFTQLSLTVTTSASAVYGAVILRVNIAGNVSDAWFDDIILAPNNIVRTAATARTPIV